MTIGFAMCGSFCTFAQVFPMMEKLAETYKIIPIFSPVACSVNSRFGTAASHVQRATDVCGTKPLSTIQEVEPIGPKKLLDALVIAPCTGNTLSKLPSPPTMPLPARRRISAGSWCGKTTILYPLGRMMP